MYQRCVGPSSREVRGDRLYVRTRPDCDSTLQQFVEAQKVFELNLSRKFYRDSTRRWAERRLHPLASMCYVSRAIAPREPWRDSSLGHW